LQHPSIVPVHELNVGEKGELFYTMKLVRGDPSIFCRIWRGVIQRRCGVIRCRRC
jgi:hypothetical protein